MSTFILSDESINDRGYRVLTSGIDTSRFSKNPIMLWMHRRDSDFNFSSVLPIGRWDNIRLEDGKLLADPVFDENDPLAQHIKRKVENGFLNAASIGIDIRKFTEEKEFLVEGQTRPTVTQCELYEASIVAIPANANAVQLMSAGPIDDKLPLLKKETTEISFKKDMSDNYQNLTKAIGEEALEVESDGRRTFTIEEMEALEVALAAKTETVEVTPESVKQELLAKEAEIDSLKALVAERDEQIKNLMAAPADDPRDVVAESDSHGADTHDFLSKDDIELYNKIKR